MHTYARSTSQHWRLRPDFTKALRLRSQQGARVGAAVFARPDRICLTAPFLSEPYALGLRLSES